MDPLTPERGSGSEDAPLLPAEVPDGVRVEVGEQDHDWVKAFGGEVTRSSPPVGSLAVGIPGVGFDLILPDGTIAESYGPDGRPLGPGALAGVQVPEITSEADDGHGKASEDGHAPEAR